MTDFAINPSICMSNLCYSIFKLDPYIACSHSCVYCYSRKFIWNWKVKTRTEYVKKFKKLLRELSVDGYPPPIPFRLSALTDPFQEIERSERLSLQLLTLCLKYNVPVIVSTKSPLVIEEPWIDVILELHDKKLVIVQYTLIVLEEDKSRILEPKAPSPDKRLSAIEKLSSEGIPVIIRFQPIIPYVNSDEEYMEKIVSTVKAAGAKQIIAECYRYLTNKDLEPFSKILSQYYFRPLTNKQLWETYPESPYKHPKIGVRYEIFQQLLKITKKYSIDFSTCREGFYNLHTAKNCCGMHYFSKYYLRPTLYEIWKEINQEENLEKTIRKLSTKITNFTEKINNKSIRNNLLKHHQIIINTIKNANTLRKICPVLMQINNKITKLPSKLTNFTLR